MMATQSVDSGEMRTAVLAVVEWLRDADAAEPSRPQLAAAVRMSVRMLAQIAPGGSVEVRVPPFVAVQCIAGLRHTRGTPPNVVETTPRTWLRIAAGLQTLTDAIGEGTVSASGSRAGEIDRFLPLI